jgi:hypothetical protein
MNLSRTFIVCLAFAGWPHAQAKSSPADSAQKSAFRQANPCPSNGETSGVCPGFVIDFIKPRACGGTDGPENMQWRSREMAKQHDKAELKACKKQMVSD